MPYIKPEERAAILSGEEAPETPGQLNFAISKMIADYLVDDISYTSINEVIGVLECAKLELYRRLAAPYEDQKLIENGDVYS